MIRKGVPKCYVDCSGGYAMKTLICQNGDPILNEMGTQITCIFSKMPLKDALQWCPPMMPFKCALKRCPSNTPLKDDLWRCPSKMPFKDAIQRCPSKMPFKAVLQRCPSKMPFKDALQRCPSKMPFPFIKEVKNHSSTSKYCQTSRKSSPGGRWSAFHPRPLPPSCTT